MRCVLDCNMMVAPVTISVFAGVGVLLVQCVMCYNCDGKHIWWLEVRSHPDTGMCSHLLRARKVCPVTLA